MSNSLPLPLSQQVLAWLVLALGYENSPDPTTQVSSGTLKNAREGAVIPKSWDLLVADVVALLGLRPVAPAALHRALREWDAAVSARRPPPLEVRDALLPVLRVAAPRLGARLAALAALVAAQTGKPVGEFVWICDPFDPHVFRRVLDLAISRVQPGLNTRQSRYDWLPSGTVDDRTAERWDAGAVPGPQIVEALIAAIGPSAEMPLRWARALAVLRRDMEGWIGTVAFNSWRKAVQSVASTTLAALADAGTIPRIAELWVEDLALTTTPETETFLAWIARSSGVEPRADDTAPWLQRVAAARHGGRAPSAAETRAVMSLTVLSPHSRLLAAVLEHHGNRFAEAFAYADLWQQIDLEWSSLGLLRAFAQGGPIERQLPGEARRSLAIPAEVRDAARTMLDEAASFARSGDPRGLTTSADRTLFAFLGVEPEAFDSELAAAAFAVPSVLFDRANERTMADSDVRAIPALALARVRRLAEAGDAPAATELLASVDVRGRELDPQARVDLSHALMAIGHASLDEFYAVARDWLAAQSGFAEDEALREEARTTIVDPIVAGVAALDQMHDAAVRGFEVATDGALPAEALVLSYPYLLRRQRLLHALGCADSVQPDATAVAAVIADRATRSPNDGPLAALYALALGLRGGTKARASADKRCEHLGTASLRDTWRARLDRDLPVSENAGSGQPTGDA